MAHRNAFFVLGVAVSLSVGLPGAARAAADPFEPANRQIDRINRLVRQRVLGPVAEFYLSVTPASVRRGVANAVANLREPIAAASGLVAGDLGLAGNAVARFGINSTLGVAGVFDPASAMGYPRQPFGLADALCRWGVPSGPFLVLPLLGPSTLRDAGAFAATSVALSQVLGTDLYATWSGSDALVEYMRLHPELKRTDAASLDPYAVYRSIYLQQRAQACPVDRRHGDGPDGGGGSPAQP